MPEPKWNPVQEVRQKYPGLKDWPDSRILENLSDPTRFRTAFPQYAHLGDDVIKRNIGDLQKGMDFTANPKAGQGVNLPAGVRVAGRNAEPFHGSLATWFRRALVGCGFTCT